MPQFSQLTKSLAFITSVLAVSLSLGYAVLAWTEPVSLPPGGNVLTPINTGNTSQIKSGNLQVNGLGVQGTLNALLVPNGNIGIGTSDTSTGRLVVSGGNIDVTGNKVINVAAPVDAADVATKSYVDAAGGGGVCYTNYGQNICAVGFTAVLSGYTTQYFVYSPANGGGLVCSSIKHDAIGFSDAFEIRASSDSYRASLLTNEPCAICCK